MSKKIRLIARLDVKDEYLVKGIQYEGLRKLGDPHDFAVRYYRQGIDELLYLDTVASLYGRNNLGEILRRATADVFIPITAGGGLRSAADVGAVLGELSTLVRDLLLRRTAPEGGAALLSGGYDDATLDRLGKETSAARLIQAACSEQALAAVPKEIRDTVRAAIYKNMLLATRT